MVFRWTSTRGEGKRGGVRFRRAGGAGTCAPPWLFPEKSIGVPTLTPVAAAALPAATLVFAPAVSPPERSAFADSGRAGGVLDPLWRRFARRLSRASVRESKFCDFTAAPSILATLNPALARREARTATETRLSLKHLRKSSALEGFFILLDTPFLDFEI